MYTVQQQMTTLCLYIGMGEYIIFICIQQIWQIRILNGKSLLLTDYELKRIQSFLWKVLT